MFHGNFDTFVVNDYENIFKKVDKEKCVEEDEKREKSTIEIHDWFFDVKHENTKNNESNSSSQEDEIKKQKVLQKNRESAKRSRENRKAVHKALLDENEKLKKQVNFLKYQITCLAYQRDVFPLFYPCTVKLPLPALKK